MAKVSKKQRSTLREISLLAKEVKSRRIKGIVAIAVMVALIIGFNEFGYNLGLIDPGNVAIRAMMYITALVIAGYSGIMLMRASQKQRSIDGLRQQAGISREMLDSWEKGEIE